MQDRTLRPSIDAYDTLVSQFLQDKTAYLTHVCYLPALQGGGDAAYFIRPQALIEFAIWCDAQKIGPPQWRQFLLLQIAEEAAQLLLAQEQGEAVTGRDMWVITRKVMAHCTVWGTLILNPSLCDDRWWTPTKEPGC